MKPKPNIEVQKTNRDGNKRHRAAAGLNFTEDG